jgi:hypothetical protein
MLTAILLRAKLHRVSEEQYGQLEVVRCSVFAIPVIVPLLIFESRHQVIVIAATIVFGEHAKLGGFFP